MSTKVYISSLVWLTLNEGQNSSKSHKNRYSCLCLKWLSKSTLKIQFWESKKKCIFSTLVWPTLNEAKIAPNLIKIGVHAYLSNGYLNQLSKHNSEKIDKSGYFQPRFDQPWTRSKIAPNMIKIGVHAYLSNSCACLSLKWVNKPTFKTQFWESQQKWIFLALV